MSEKIQKILASAGLGSRRQIEDWLRAGRITVNGKPAKLGDRITRDAKVRVDQREVRLLNPTHTKVRVLLYHKPEGEMCTRKDPEGRPTVFDKLPMLRNSRWISIGRLDFNTSGLLLFTNHGELANELMHPSKSLEREYAVRIQGKVTPSMLTNLRSGVTLEDGPAHFESITDEGGEGTNHWFHVIVKQGRNRLVRRLWESQNVTVSRLIRIRFGALTLPRMLRRGKWNELTPEEIAQLNPKTIQKPLSEFPKPKRVVNKRLSSTKTTNSKVLRLKRNNEADEEHVPIKIKPRKIQKTTHQDKRKSNFTKPKRKGHSTRRSS
ncbi:MAG: pseudouridine synthase [Gammaproteobacteria bacterium]|nr:pseudouridine synthase [Gammaproteobacteria bacterium]